MLSGNYAVPSALQKSSSRILSVCSVSYEQTTLCCLCWIALNFPQFKAIWVGIFPYFCQGSFCLLWTVPNQSDVLSCFICTYPGFLLRAAQSSRQGFGVGIAALCTRSSYLLKSVLCSSVYTSPCLLAFQTATRHQVAGFKCLSTVITKSFPWSVFCSLWLENILSTVFVNTPLVIYCLFIRLVISSICACLSFQTWFIFFSRIQPALPVSWLSCTH